MGVFTLSVIFYVCFFNLKIGFFFSLKTLDTIGNCQRLVFTFGVSEHMHKITNLWKFELSSSSKLRDINERKKHPCRTMVLILIPQILNLRSQNQISRKLLLSQRELFLTMFYTFNLITRYQERFYDNNYFE